MLQIAVWTGRSAFKSRPVKCVMSFGARNVRGDPLRSGKKLRSRDDIVSTHSCLMDVTYGCDLTHVATIWNALFSSPSLFLLASLAPLSNSFLQDHDFQIRYRLLLFSCLSVTCLSQLVVLCLPPRLLFRQCLCIADFFLSSDATAQALKKEENKRCRGHSGERVPLTVPHKSVIGCVRLGLNLFSRRPVRICC